MSSTHRNLKIYKADFRFHTKPLYAMTETSAEALELFLHDLKLKTLPKGYTITLVKYPSHSG